MEDFHQLVKNFKNTLGTPVFIPSMKISNNKIFNFLLKGIKFMVEYKYKEAIDVFTEIINKKKIKNEEEAFVLILRGICYENLGGWNYTEAYRNFDEALVLLQGINNEEGEAICIINKWFICQITGEKDEVKKYVDEWNERISKSCRKNKELEAWGNIYLGAFYRHQNNLEEAFKRYYKALEISKNINSKLLMGWALDGIGVTQGRMGLGKEECEKSLKDAFNYFKEIKNLRGELWISRHLGQIYLKRGDFNNGLKYFERCLNISRNLKWEEVSFVERMGDIIYGESPSSEEALKYYEEALKYYKEALNMCEKILNNLLLKKQSNKVEKIVSKIVEILCKMASTYIKLINIEKAEEYLRKAEEIKCEDQKINRYILSTRARIIISKENPKPEELDEAIWLCEKALKIYSDNRNKAWTLGTLGKIYLKKNDYDMAMKHFKEAEDTERKDPNLKQLLSWTIGKEGEVYLAQNKTSEALNKFKEAFNINVELQNRRGICFNLKQLYKAYEKSGKIDEEFQKYCDLAIETLKKIGAYKEIKEIEEIKSKFLKPK